MEDAYEELIQAKGDTRAAAKVSISYGQATEFAREKFSVSVTLTCDQNKKMLNKAAELGVDTVKELTEMAMRGFSGKAG